MPLQDGRYAYGRYLHPDQQHGPLCEVYKSISERSLSMEELDTKERLFPPVYIGFGSFFKIGRWRNIGNMPVARFAFPKFRHTFGSKPGEYHDWKIYDGNNTELVGDLTPEMRSLEFLCVWSPQAMEKRIETGVNRFDKLY